MADDNMFDVMGDYDELIGEYVEFSHDDEGNTFVIVFDMSGLVKAMGFDSYDEAESFLNDIYGDNWGYGEDWASCYMCGKAIHLDPYSNGGGYWIDYEGGSLYCGDCVNYNEDVTDEYIDYLKNSVDAANLILTPAVLEEHGFKRLEGNYEYNRFGGRMDSPQTVLDELLSKYPSGEFIFDVTGNNRWNTSYVVWGRGIDDEA